MATDGPDPPACDNDVYWDGTPIFMSFGIPSNAFEGWVKSVKERSGQRVDWHFIAGRAIVKCLGDIPAVRAAVADLLPDHDALWRRHNDDDGCAPSRSYL